MAALQFRLTKSFRLFFESKKSAGIALLFCTVISLCITNSPLGNNYIAFWQIHVAGLSLEHWANDALMAIFFLLIGLELERELYRGELSNIKNALLPIIAAVGGIVTPAFIHFSMNAGTATQSGLGIPMATDIAFALGVLALLGSRIPASLKIFLTALAVMDDLGAIIVIALFYTNELAINSFIMAMGIFVLMVMMNRIFHVMALLPYLICGTLMWYFMLKSGVHATISGVLLAFAIPFSTRDGDEKSPSHKLEHFLHKPVAFLILPIFALANTGIVINMDSVQSLLNSNSLGIMLGLILGKPIGIMLFSCIAVWTGFCRLPAEMNWKHVFGAGLLGGIGFTMSIFITNLAFPDDETLINSSKLAILFASLLAGLIGFSWLKRFGHTTGNP